MAVQKVSDRQAYLIQKFCVRLNARVQTDKMVIFQIIYPVSIYELLYFATPPRLD